MVIGEIGVNQKATKPSFATPSERFAALLIDVFTVLTPLIALAVAPFKKQLTISALLSEPHNVFIFALLSATIIFLFTVLYKTVSTWKYNGTFGQRILGLTVVSKTLVPITLSDAFLRSVFWCLGPVTLAFTWMGVFNDSERRTWHDRLSGTLVTSRKTHPVNQPEFQEKTFARAYSMSVAFLFLGLLFAVSFALYRGLQGSQLLNAQLQLTCPEIDSAVVDWPNVDETDSTDRLEVAMTLFAAGQVDKSCLSTEVDYHFQQGYESPISYLASSFVNSDDPELSDRYLRTVCKVLPESQSCKMSQMIEMWSDENWKEINSLVSELKDSEKAFVSVWIVRHLVNQSEFNKAIQKINDLRQYPFLNAFLGVQFAKAKWGKEQDASAIAIADGLDFSLGAEESFELDAWLCNQMLSQNCDGTESSVCTRTQVRLQEEERYLRLPVASLAIVKSHICENGKSNFAKLRSDNLDKDIRTVVEIIQSLNETDANKKRHSKNVELLREMYTNTEIDHATRQYVFQVLIDETDELSEIADLVLSWKDDRTTVDWFETGKKLVKRFEEESLDSEAFEIASQIQSVRSDDSKWSERTAILAFKANRFAEAKILLTQIDKLSKSVVADRIPASVEAEELTLDLIRKKLK